MHIDNLKVLNYKASGLRMSAAGLRPLDKLKVGIIVIEESRNRCSYVVQNFVDIKNVICPIFLQFPLLTSLKISIEL